MNASATAARGANAETADDGDTIAPGSQEWAGPATEESVADTEKFEVTAADVWNNMVARAKEYPMVLLVLTSSL